MRRTAVCIEALGQRHLEERTALPPGRRRMLVASARRRVPVVTHRVVMPRQTLVFPWAHWGRTLTRLFERLSLKDWSRTA